MVTASYTRIGVHLYLQWLEGPFLTMVEEFYGIVS